MRFKAKKVVQSSLSNTDTEGIELRVRGHYDGVTFKTSLSGLSVPTKFSVLLISIDMFWYWYRRLIKHRCLCECRREMVHTANCRHLVPWVSVIKRLSLYKKKLCLAPKGRDFVSVVRIREGPYYGGFFGGNVWEFCRCIRNCQRKMICSSLYRVHSIYEVKRASD